MARGQRRNIPIIEDYTQNANTIANWVNSYDIVSNSNMGKVTADCLVDKYATIEYVNEKCSHRRRKIKVKVRL